MGIFGRRKEKKIYSLGRAMELAQKPENEGYEFEPVDSENIEKGYRMVPREQARMQIEEIRENQKKEFENYVTGNGVYRNIDQRGGNHSNNQYNQYQKAKRYKPEKYESR